MPTQFNSETNIYRLNEGDLLANGKNDTSSANAGRTPVLDPESGLASTTVAIDGDLRTIDTASEAIALDPAANTSGNASAKHSQSFLLRWLVKLLQPLASAIYTEGATDSTITGVPVLWEAASNTLSTISSANPLPVSASSTVALAVFKAIANGTGFSTGDIIVLRQTPPSAPEYYNATTNAVIAAPNPASLGPIASSSNVVVDSGTVTANLGTIGLAATAANQASTITLTGAVTETAPANDTASSGLNGRLQRIAQRLTSLIGLIPSGLTVTSTRLLVDGSGVTQPVSVSGGTTEVTLLQVAAAGRGTLTAHNTSSANAAATFTISAPGAGIAIQICTLFFGYSAAPTAGTLTIASTGITSIVIPVTAAGAGFLQFPVRANANQALSVTLAAGGSGVVGYCSAIYSTVAA
jgi:hypothetical protein